MPTTYHLAGFLGEVSDDDEFLALLIAHDAAITLGYGQFCLCEDDEAFIICLQEKILGCSLCIPGRIRSVECREPVDSTSPG